METILFSFAFVSHAQPLLMFLAGLSAVLTLWQWAAARRFPLHRRLPASHAPPVTLLKPLKGRDAGSERCLQSWFEQDYAGEMQILFAVASEDDPVCGLVRELIARHPAREARLVVCSAELGLNPKISKLIQLQSLVRHEALVISDADVRVPPDFLSGLMSQLQDPETGLVNCFYRLENLATPALRWESIAINADFWSQVLQAQTLKPLDFALGAVMATTRTRLQAIGGFEALADYLADDFLLGRKIAASGGRIVLSPLVVECWSGPMGWAEVWKHQLRWSLTIRVCQPGPYFLSILGNATLWPLLWAGVERSAASLAGLALCLLLRISTALDNQRRLRQAPGRWREAWLVPMKDLLQAALWALSFLSSQIEWRGARYRVLRGGKLQPLR